MTPGRDDNVLDPAVEAVLFAYGNPISIEDLCYALDDEYEKVMESIGRLRERYRSRCCGIRLLKLNNCYQLCTAQEYAAAVRTALGLEQPMGISKSALEVLLIVASFQPTTQRFIDETRGTDSSYWTAWLVEHELIEPAGRLDRRGQPKAYATTLNFLRMFNLSSVSEVPELGAEIKNTAAQGQQALDLDSLAGLI